MKKLARILAVALVAFTLTITLASCSPIRSGSYFYGYMMNSTYTLYTFDGNKFTMQEYVNGQVIEQDTISGTYKVKDDQITFTWGEKGAEETMTLSFAEDEENGILYIGETPFAPYVVEEE